MDARFLGFRDILDRKHRIEELLPLAGSPFVSPQLLLTRY